MEYIIMAYLGDSGHWEAKDIDVSGLTHINYAFAAVLNGKLSGKHMKNLDQLRKLKEKKPSLKTMISIGGWQADGFSDAVLTKGSRTVFMDSILEFVAANDFDGVDLDWEYPGMDHGGITARPEDKQHYTLFVKQLRDGLDRLGHQSGRQYQLTMAMGSGPRYVEALEMDQLIPCFDYLNLMTYDLCGGGDPKTGHHTGLFRSKSTPDAICCDDAVRAVLHAGVEPKKIVLGIAFYGRGWSSVANRNHGLGQTAGGEGPDGGAYSYSDIKASYSGKNGFVRYWDEDAKAPYLYNGDTFITYEDEKSISHKTRYIREKGLAGAMFWEYKQDKSGRLLHQICSGLKQ